MGGVIGTALMVGVALRADRDHHIDGDKRILYIWDIWGASWGGVLGAEVGRLTAQRRCHMPRPQPLPAPPHDCGRAALSGAVKGAGGGALITFLVAPIFFIGPGAISGVGGGHFDFGRAVVVTTGAGAAVGAPLVAYREHEARVRSANDGQPRVGIGGVRTNLVMFP